ncbi:MAG: hypothetical protein SFU91_00250 [Chloroherpetonaceae bacterium]|nr:hypothetical protein [Chloroherpetonaceae bacterium]
MALSKSICLKSPTLLVSRFSFNLILIFSNLLFHQIAFSGWIFSTDTTKIGNTETNKHIETSFQRIFNTVFFKSKADYLITTNTFQLSVMGNFLSTLADFEERAIRDETRIETEALYRLSSILKTGLSFSRFSLNDNRRLFRNDASITSLSGGFILTPTFETAIQTNLSPFIKFFGGFKDDAQLGNQTDGFFYQALGSIDQVRLNDFIFSLRGSSQDDFLGERRNYSRGIQFGTNGNFLNQDGEEISTLGVSFGYDETRRDFFSILGAQDAAPIIERRIERMFFTSDSVSYRAFQHLRIVVEADLRSRLIRRENSQQFLDLSSRLYDNQISQNGLGGRIAAQFENQSIFFSLSIAYQFQTENYQPINSTSDSLTAIRLEAFRNNNFEVASINAHIRTDMGKADDPFFNRIFFGGQIRGFAYNTPSLENTDDRDELGFYADLTDSLFVSPQFLISATLSAALTHTVFIFAAQSGNNRWNRIFRFAPSTKWNFKSWLTTHNSFSVLANYTVYDFESPVSVRSFSFRQFSFTDSTLFRISTRHSLKFIYETRRYERGELYWNSFSERPINAFHDQLFVSAFIVESSSLKGSIGIRWFKREQFGFVNSERRLQTSLTYFGPTASVSFSPQSNIVLSAEGWYQIEETNGSFTRATPNLSLFVSALW